MLEKGGPTMYHSPLEKGGCDDKESLNAGSLSMEQKLDGNAFLPTETWLRVHFKLGLRDRKCLGVCRNVQSMRWAACEMGMFVQEPLIGADGIHFFPLSCFSLDYRAKCLF